MEEAGTRLALFLQSYRVAPAVARARQLVRDSYPNINMDAMNRAWREAVADFRRRLERLLIQTDLPSVALRNALRNGWVVDVNRSYPIGYVDDDRRPRWRNGRFMSYYNGR